MALVRKQKSSSVYIWKTLLFLSSFFVQSRILVQGQTIQTLIPNTVKKITALPNETFRFQLTNIPEKTRTIIFQIHSQIHNLTVSETSDPDISTTLVGTNVGLETILWTGQTSAAWFVNTTCGPNTTAVCTGNVTFLVSTYLYLAQDPIPGGCNMEFNLEYDPNIHLSYSEYLTNIKFQYANIGYERYEKEPNCESRIFQSSLHYDVYQYFLREKNFEEKHFIDALEQSQNISWVQNNARKVMTLEFLARRTNISFASYTGQGSVYFVVVRQSYDNGDESSAMYVPTASYGCNLKDETDTCYDIDNAAVQVFAVFLGLVGLFICFLGHRYFKFEMFIFGYYAFALIFYIILSLGTDWSITSRVYVAGTLGVFGGLGWLLFWVMYGIPVLSVLLVGLDLGFVFSSILFNMTPLGDLETFKGDLSYGLTFLSGILIPSVILLAFTKKLSIVSCGVVGAFTAILACDAGLNTSLSFIILNSVRKAVVPGYLQAVVHVPFQSIDIILCILWGVLAVLGITLQLWREKDRVDFPPCPYKEYKMKKRRRELANMNTEESSDGDEGGSTSQNESASLLRGENRRNYNAVA